MNEADSEKLAAGLAKLGWEEAPKANEADLAVVNTCVVRQKAEDRAAGYLGLLRKLKESRDGGLQIAVMGCMVGPRTDDLRSRFPYVDVWARPQSFEVVLRAVMPESELGGEFWPDTFPEPKGPTAFVPVIHGCNKFCTYCIVPYRRGRERSRTIEDIAREVGSHCARGVREVTLLGQTVEAYGKDLPGPSLDTSAPRGADYSGRTAEEAEEYVEWVHRIREIVPDATLSTDVIVGFCGETEEQFGRTLAILEDLRFDKVHVAAYSPRPGTIAWRHMEDTVPQAEKMRRLHAVEALQERVGSEINARLVGTVQEVLVEGEKDGVLTGRNRGNKLVHVRQERGRSKEQEQAPAIGDLVDARITKATAWSLQGEVAASVAA